MEYSGYLFSVICCCILFSVNDFTFNFAYMVLFHIDNCYFDIVKHIDLLTHRAKAIKLRRQKSVSITGFSAAREWKQSLQYAEEITNWAIQNS